MLLRLLPTWHKLELNYLGKGNINRVNTSVRLVCGHVWGRFPVLKGALRAVPPQAGGPGV